MKRSDLSASKACLSGLPTDKKALSCQPSAPFLHPALDEGALQPGKQHKKHRALVQELKKVKLKKVKTPSWCTSYDPTYTAASSAQPPLPLQASMMQRN